MIHVRVTAEFKTRLEEAAKSSGRSLNSEILHRLQASFRHDEERVRDAEQEALFEEIHRHQEQIELEKIEDEHYLRTNREEYERQRDYELRSISSSLGADDLLELLRIRLTDLGAK